MVETNIPLDKAYDADEAFFTGTAAEVTPIRSINDKQLGNGSIGAITSMIKNTYLDIVKGNNTQFMEYLTYV